VENTVGAATHLSPAFIYGVLMHYDIRRCLQTGAGQAARVVEVFEPWVNY